MNRLSIISKTILTFVVCCACAFSASSAQCYKISSVDKGNPDIALRYLEQTDTTTLIYAVLTLPDEIREPILFNISKSVHITDGDFDYKLVKAHNAPIEDESLLEYCILDGKQRKLNFILEFEQFPFEDKFDMVDDPDDDRTLNFQGISVDSSTGKDFNRDRFLRSTKLTRCGEFYDKGDCYLYYDRDDVFVSCHSSYGDDNFTLYLSIFNDSDHGVLFKTDNLTIKGHQVKKQDTTLVDLHLYSKSEYVDLVASNDRYEASRASRSEGLSEIGSIISLSSIGIPWRSVEHSGLRILGGFLQDIEHNYSKPYRAELEKTREERTKNYLQSQSIKSGENLCGYIRVTRPKNVNDYYLVLHMDGYDFEFYESIK